MYFCRIARMWIWLYSAIEGSGLLRSETASKFQVYPFTQKGSGGVDPTLLTTSRAMRGAYKDYRPFERCLQGSRGFHVGLVGLSEGNPLPAFQQLQWPAIEGSQHICGTSRGL